MNTVTLLDRPVAETPRGDVWSYISPSRLNLWLKCPLAFRLRYLDGVTTPTSAAQFVGRRVHAALEWYYRHRQLGVLLAAEHVVSQVTDRWEQAVTDEQIAFANSAEESECRQQTMRLVSAYMAQLSPTEPRPLAVETTLESPLVDPATGERLGIPLLGVIDLVLDDAAGPAIVDFKTASRGGELAEILHEVQLTSYAYLFRQVAGCDESRLEIRSLVKTKVPKIKSHAYGPRNDKHFGRLFAVIRAYLDDLDGERFIYRPNMTCSSCEFRSTHCRRWAG